MLPAAPILGSQQTRFEINFWDPSDGGPQGSVVTNPIGMPKFADLPRRQHRVITDQSRTQEIKTRCHTQKNLRYGNANDALASQTFGRPRSPHPSRSRRFSHHVSRRSQTGRNRFPAKLTRRKLSHQYAAAINGRCSGLGWGAKPRRIH